MGGGDKALLRIGDLTLVDRVIARLRPQCGALALNANGDRARFGGFGLPVLADSLPDFPGPLAGILAGMEWAAEQGATAVVSVAVDTPFFPDDLVARLVAHAGQSGLALAAGRDAQGRVVDHPTFGLWPTALRDDLRATLRAGRRRVRSFAEAHVPGRAVWRDDPFFNINTPEDLARARMIVAG